MPTQPDSFDEFLRRVEPLMQSPPLYQSIQFACVAARHGSNWILIAGSAVLSAEPANPGGQISPLVQVNGLLGLSGRISVVFINHLVDNLRDSWVTQGMGSCNVRLIQEGANAYFWTAPVVHTSGKGSRPSMPWNRAFSVFGSGPNLSSLFSPLAWAEIDNQLRRSTPPTPAFKDFDALCGKLGLAAQRGNLQSSFLLSAELPARFVGIQNNQKGSIEVEIECVGGPDLMIDWLPDHDFDRLAPGWREPTGDHHHVSLPVPEGAAGADLVLSFAGLDADTGTVEIMRERPSAPGPAPRIVQPHEQERWKRTGETVGEGGQAQVFIVEDTRKEHKGQWAQKTLKNINDPKAKERFGREIKAVQSINHPNILKIVHSGLTAERPYFVAEYCERGSLQKIGASQFKGDIAAMRKVVLPILDALVAAHKARVFHRDVKPANILIRGDGTPVIGDFGICFVEGGELFTLSTEGVGSRNFIAPEMESGQHGLGEPSDRTDVYSLGKVIYWMLSGGKEFAREDYPSLVDLLKDQRFAHVHRLLEQMVVREPAKRIQSHEVKEKLELTSSLVEGSFAPLAPSVGIRCRFCGLGQYERVAAYDAGDPSKSLPYPDGTSGLGLHPVSPGTNVRCLRCSHCGHVEWFQFTEIKNTTWWEK